ncbi:MAG: GGDEF domain-containing protein [Candidatus Nanopelagicales bacterium]|nr:GGDEF domain-containing protein [Candidatus Nanopelagicales bacterium]
MDSGGTTHERTAFRQFTAAQESAWVAASTAGITTLLSLANSVIGPGANLRQNLPSLVAAAALAIAAVLFARRLVPVPLVPWVGAGLAVTLVAALHIQEYTYFSSTGLMYSLFVITAYGPIALDFRVFSVAAIPMAAGSVLVALSQGSMIALDWLGGTVAAFVISGTLLWLRQRSVDALGRALAVQESLATEDPLTGLLNRRGLEDRIDQILAMAVRQGQPVWAQFVDIDGLKAVNDQHGHHRGDAVIRDAAVALRAVTRAEDLVGRWGGDEFVVVGIGEVADPDAVQARLCDHLTQLGIDRAVWPGHLTVGCASIDPALESFEQLVISADAHMYARKGQQP